MTTATLSENSHSAVQRSRFVQLALASIANLFQASPARAPADAADVQSVRKLASSYASTDPGFAADLYAAADRHELEMDSLAV